MEKPWRHWCQSKSAAMRLIVDWDSVAEIEEADESDDPEDPAAVGYGALYLVSAFPIIIGISVVLILFLYFPPVKVLPFLFLVGALLSFICLHSAILHALVGYILLSNRVAARSLHYLV